MKTPVLRILLGALTGAYIMSSAVYAEPEFRPLFPKDGVPEGWVARLWSDVSKPAPEGAVWKVENGILLVNLDKEIKNPKRHDNTDAPPLKERPRNGHIGFQELSRGDGHVQIRGARIAELE